MNIYDSPSVDLHFMAFSRNKWVLFSVHFVTCQFHERRRSSTTNREAKRIATFLRLLNIWLSEKCAIAWCGAMFHNRRTMTRRAIKASKHESPWKGLDGKKMLKINKRKMKTNKKCSREEVFFSLLFVNVWTLRVNNNDETKKEKRVFREGIKIASWRNR